MIYLLLHPAGSRKEIMAKAELETESFAYKSMATQLLQVCT